MRCLALILVVIPLLSGCELRERFGSPEDRINGARPLGADLPEHFESLRTQVLSRPAALGSVMQAWNARLIRRANTCAGGYRPSWTESADDIRVHLVDAECFERMDGEGDRWVSRQRIRWMLDEPAVPVTPEDIPGVVGFRDAVLSLSVARSAPIAIAKERAGYEVINLASGRSLHFEHSPQAASLHLSPNGKLYAESGDDGFAVRLGAGGETLASFPALGFVDWVGTRHIALYSRETHDIELLDLETGDRAAVPGLKDVQQATVYPVPGRKDRFVLTRLGGVLQFDVVPGTEGAGFTVRVGRELESFDADGDSGALSQDGSAWMGGMGGLHVLRLDTLEPSTVSLQPLRIYSSWPTSDPDRILLGTLMPRMGDVDFEPHYYVYSRSEASLGLVQFPGGSGTRFVWIPALRRLGVLEGRSLNVLQALPVKESRPIADVITAEIETQTQRHEAAAASARLLADRRLIAPGQQTEPATLEPQFRNTYLAAIGIYKGATRRTKYMEANAVGVVQVHVKPTAQPTVLVLAAYDPVNWIVTLEPGARLAGVLLSGHGTATVGGIGNAPVYQMGQAWAYERGSPAYTALQNSVKQWTGRAVDEFQGRYQGVLFFVGEN